MLYLNSSVSYAIRESTAAISDGDVILYELMAFIKYGAA